MEAVINYDKERRKYIFAVKVEKSCLEYSQRLAKDYFQTANSDYVVIFEADTLRGVRNIVDWIPGVKKFIRSEKRGIYNLLEVMKNGSKNRI